MIYFALKSLRKHKLEFNGAFTPMIYFAITLAS